MQTSSKQSKEAYSEWWQDRERRINEEWWYDNIYRELHKYKEAGFLSEEGQSRIIALGEGDYEMRALFKITLIQLRKDYEQTQRQDREDRVSKVASPSTS